MGFDIISFNELTKVPIEDAVQIINEKLQEDMNIFKWHSKIHCALFNLNFFFLRNGTFYEQQSDYVMGPFAANVLMENLEEVAFDSFVY